MEIREEKGDFNLLSIEALHCTIGVISSIPSFSSLHNPYDISC